MFKFRLVLLSLLLGLLSCSPDDDLSNDMIPEDDFDRSAMLTHWADNIIIPVYQDLNSKVSAMANKKDAFLEDPTASSMQELRAVWEEAYIVWQHAEMFNLGEAESLNYVFQMNVYPTNVEDIQANIGSQSYDLSSVNNNDAVGFPAVEYMLFGLAENDAEIIDYYSDFNDANKFKTYLSDLIDKMQSLTETVLEDWTNSYRDEFIAGTENTATGSVNLTVNDFIFYYEKGFRANKFGIPAGNFSSTPLPDRVEAYYQRELSKTLALEARKAIYNFFNGISYAGTNNGQSLDDYLDYLNTIKREEDLSTLINDQLNEVEAKINSLNDNFVTQVESNNVAMTQTFDVIQVGVVLFKVDMLQALDISVDYVDADGD